MAEEDTKRSISRKDLEAHGIYYNADVFTPSTSHTLPDHVDEVRKSLLSFENTIPPEWEEDLRQEFHKFGEADFGPQSSAFISLTHCERASGERSEIWKTAHQNLKRFQHVAKRAQELLEDPEAEWSFFWRSNVFTLFSDESCELSRFTPALARLDPWSLYESVTWNEFENIWKPCNPSEKHRTLPKPDLTYAFPIKGLPHSRLKGCVQDSYRHTLPLPMLEKLVRQGISCTPTTGLRKWTNLPDKTSLSSSDKSCFPWAVVEMKRHATSPESNTIERCYCQAANAAAAALQLQAQLFSKLDGNVSSPPVVAFTCIGPTVKVWLAYQDEPEPSGRPKQRMVCIWSTSVLLTWGVASLRTIVMNMHIWASRTLKLEIHSCLHQVSRGIQTSSHSNPQTPPNKPPNPPPFVHVYPYISQPLSIRAAPPLVFGSSRINTPSNSPLPLNQSDHGSSSSIAETSTPRIPLKQNSAASLLESPRADTPKDSHSLIDILAVVEKSKTLRRKIATQWEASQKLPGRQHLVTVENRPIFSPMPVIPTRRSPSPSGQESSTSLFHSPKANTPEIAKPTFDSSYWKSVFDVETEPSKGCTFFTPPASGDRPAIIPGTAHPTSYGSLGSPPMFKLPDRGTTASGISVVLADENVKISKMHPHPTEPEKQATTLRTSDRAREVVDDIISDLGSFSLEDFFSQTCCGSEGVHELKAVRDLEAPLSRRLSPPKTKSEHHTKHKEAYNSISDAGKKNSSRSDDRAQLDSDRVSDGSVKHQDADDNGSDSDSVCDSDYDSAYPDSNLEDDPDADYSPELGYSSHSSEFWLDSDSESETNSELDSDPYRDNVAISAGASNSNDSSSGNHSDPGDESDSDSDPELSPRPGRPLTLRNAYVSTFTDEVEVIICKTDRLTQGVERKIYTAPRGKRYVRSRA